jgi:Predicted archaeal methyltransferase
MKRMPDNCVDLIATDPPYNLELFNVSWDKALPSQETFNEMCRVLKPGAFCFVMTSARQDLNYRVLQRLENAGFMIDFPSLYWTYATGIGLAPNVSKMIDKRLGAERSGEIKKGLPDQAT